MYDNKHTNMMESTGDLNPIHRTTDNQGMLRVGNIVFPREEHTHQLVIKYQMVSPENLHTSNII